MAHLNHDTLFKRTPIEVAQLQWEEKKIFHVIPVYRSRKCLDFFFVITKAT